MQGATGNWYCGLHEYQDMAFVLDFLRQDDLFVDVGANVGTYTLLASGVCGSHTLSLEPGERAFERLGTNVRLNGLEALVDARCVGASNRTGQALFTIDADTTNRMAIGALDDLSLPVVSGQATIRVDTLDALLDGRQPAAMKIDVEGWETAVLQGAEQTLTCGSLHACIIEDNESGRDFGFSSDDVASIMAAHGFMPHSYDPGSRQLRPAERRHGSNVLFIRNPDEVQRRVLLAPDRLVLGHSLHPFRT
jgi:FkbM family methyltransferase